MLVFVIFAIEEEVLDGDVDQVAPAQQLHDAPLEQPRRRRDRDHAEHERADQPVGERAALHMLRQALREDAEHQGVVDRQNALEEDQEADDDEVVPVKGLSEHA